MELSGSLMQYLHMGQVAGAVRDVLAAGLIQYERSLPASRRQALRQALTHLGDVREGFVISARTSQVASPEELRYLIARVLLDWGWVEAAGLVLEPGEAVEQPELQLVAFAHSCVSLGLLPRMAPHQITYPVGRRTYADIPVPRTPGEVLERIEELERALTVLELEPLAALEESTVKRTYGFFETSAWLVAYHRRLFLGPDA